MNGERKPWTPPYTDTEWIILSLLVLGALMLGAFAFIFYTGVSLAFGVEIDFLSLAPVVIIVILFVVFNRRRRRPDR